MQNGKGHDSCLAKINNASQPLDEGTAGTGGGHVEVVFPYGSTRKTSCVRAAKDAMAEAGT